MNRVECGPQRVFTEKGIIRFPNEEERLRRKIERSLPRQSFELTLSGGVSWDEAWEKFEDEFNPERQEISDERLVEATRRREIYGEGFYFNEKGLLGIWQAGASLKRRDIVLYGFATVEQRARETGVEAWYLIGQNGYFIRRLLRRANDRTVLKELLYRNRTKTRIS